MNRVGMESRALQLAMMGMKKILAVTETMSAKGSAVRGRLFSTSIRCNWRSCSPW